MILFYLLMGSLLYIVISEVLNFMRIGKYRDCQNERIALKLKNRNLKFYYWHLPAQTFKALDWRKINYLVIPYGDSGYIYQELECWARWLEQCWVLSDELHLVHERRNPFNLIINQPVYKPIKLNVYYAASQIRKLTLELIDITPLVFQDEE